MQIGCIASDLRVLGASVLMQTGCVASVLVHLFLCKQGASLLFMPRLPANYAVWMGALKTPEDYKAM